MLRNKQPVFAPPKTAKSRRSVALSPDAIGVLQQHYDQRKAVCESIGISMNGDDLVFGDVSGSPLSPNTVSHAFRDICNKARIDGIRFHDLRHTHATLLMKQGVNPKVVQERLGHSNISVTLDIYSHVVPGMQELAALQFDEALKETTNYQLDCLQVPSSLFLPNGGVGLGGNSVSPEAYNQGGKVPLD